MHVMVSWGIMCRKHCASLMVMNFGRVGCFLSESVFIEVVDEDGERWQRVLMWKPIFVVVGPLYNLCCTFRDAKTWSSPRRHMTNVFFIFVVLSDSAIASVGLVLLVE